MVSRPTNCKPIADVWMCVERCRLKQVSRSNCEKTVHRETVQGHQLKRKRKVNKLNSAPIADGTNVCKTSSPASVSDGVKSLSEKGTEIWRGGLTRKNKPKTGYTTSTKAGPNWVQQKDGFIGGQRTVFNVHLCPDRKPCASQLNGQQTTPAK